MSRFLGRGSSASAPTTPSSIKTNSSEALAPEEDGAPAAEIKEPTGEEGKLKLIAGLLKKFLGVKDLASLRLSLPASLMEPVPNLEYWQAGDRSDIFASIGDSEDPLERMLAALRFSFTIQLKFVRNKVCKPYNSVLSEWFICHWEPIPSSIHPSTLEPVISTSLHDPAAPSSADPQDPEISGYNTPGSGSKDQSDTSSIKSHSSKKSSSSKKSGKGRQEARVVNDLGGASTKPVKVAFLCKQVSHHPPISSAYYICPEKGIEACNVDQISAKVSGMTVRIGPGPLNKGYFVRLTRDGPGKGEEYQITNPQANVNGLLKGTFYGTISDFVTITCRGTDATERYRTIIEYKDESWISKPRFLLEGVVYKYKTSEADSAESWTKIKEVPSSMVAGTFEGCWRGEIYFKPKGSKESRLLLDMDILGLIPKHVRPLASQSEFESRRLWDPVTVKMMAKAWGEATAAKQQIEQAQRDRAAARKEKNETFVPTYFEEDISDGRPRLTEAGRKAIAAELAAEGY